MDTTDMADCDATMVNEHNEQWLLKSNHKWLKLSKIRQLVPKFIDASTFKSETPEQYSLLQMAILNGCCKSVIKYLHKHGVNINYQNANGETALHICCAMKNMSMIRHLISLGANPDLQDKLGFNVLHTSCKNNFYGILKFLLTRMSPVECTGNEGNSPLHVVCAHPTLQSCRMIKLLLKREVNVNATNKHGKTALHLTCQDVNDQSEGILLLLLNNKADITLQDHMGKTPVDYCTDNSHSSAVKLLAHLIRHYVMEALVDDSFMDSLMRALQTKSSKMTQCLALIHKSMLVYEDRYINHWTHNNILEKFLIDVFEEYHNSCPVTQLVDTVLHCATEHYPKFAEFIIRKCNVIMNRQNSEGKTPLHIAVARDDEEITTLLLKKMKTEDINIRDNSNQIAPQYVKSTAVLQQFIIFRHDIPLQVFPQAMLHSFTDTDGNNLLHLAATHFNVDVIKYLLNENWDVNTQNYKGDTLLHILCGRNLLLFQKEFVKMKTLSWERYIGEPTYSKLSVTLQSVIDAKANISIKNKSLDTPLCLAFKECNYIAFYILLQKINSYDIVNHHLGKYMTSQFINVRNNFRDTLLHAACRVKANTIVVQDLINSGVDIHKQDAQGYRAIHIAALQQDLPTVELLLKTGEKPDYYFDKGYIGNNCIVDLVCKNDNNDVMKMLIDTGLDINHKYIPYSDNVSVAPLQTAMLYNNIAVVKLLLEAGADINWKHSCKLDYYSETHNMNILQWSIVGRSKHYRDFPLSIAEYLLRSGVDVNGKCDKNKYRAIDFLLCQCKIRHDNSERKLKQLYMLLSAGSRDINFSIVCNKSGLSFLFGIYTPPHFFYFLRLLGYKGDCCFKDRNRYHDMLFSHPISLKEQCAKAIRPRLKPNALVGVSKLPLPHCLQKCVICYYESCDLSITYPFNGFYTVPKELYR